MYWLWKWLESYNICTFSTWKDKRLFNLLFWIPNLFCTFHDLVGEELISFPPLTAGPSLIFIIQIFKQLACLEKQSLPWKFSLHWNIFHLSGFLRNLSLPWKQSLPWIFQAGGAAAPPPRTPLFTGAKFLVLGLWTL